MLWAVLPLKDFSNAKQRLAPVLHAIERRRLFQSMVEDVLQQLTQCAVVHRVLVISDDPMAEQLTYQYDFELLTEQGQGLNLAVLQAQEYVAAQGGGRMMVLHGDLPLIDQSSLWQLADPKHADSVVLAPDAAELGTNVMVFDCQHSLEFHYGENSLNKHLNMLERQNLKSTVLKLPKVAVDVDDPQDLVALCKGLKLARNSAEKTAEYMQQSGIYERFSNGLEASKSFTPTSINDRLAEV